jgi:hypothetical protein
MAKLVSKILGVLYVVVGLAGLVLGDDADRYHNLLHFGTGLFALYFGFAASLSGAKSFCLAFGAAYLAFGMLGFAMGNPAMGRMWDLGLMSVSTGDHVHHMVLGTIILAGGIFTKGSGSQSPTSSIRHGQSAIGSER